MTNVSANTLQSSVLLFLLNASETDRRYGQGLLKRYDLHGHNANSDGRVDGVYLYRGDAVVIRACALGWLTGFTLEQLDMVLLN